MHTLVLTNTTHADTSVSTPAHNTPALAHTLVHTWCSHTHEHFCMSSHPWVQAHTGAHHAHKAHIAGQTRASAMHWCTPPRAKPTLCKALPCANSPPSCSPPPSLARTLTSPVATLKASSSRQPTAVRTALDECISFHTVSLSTWGGHNGDIWGGHTSLPPPLPIYTHRMVIHTEGGSHITHCSLPPPQFIHSQSCDTHTGGGYACPPLHTHTALTHGGGHTMLPPPKNTYI